MFEIQVKIKHGHRAKNTKQTQAETQKTEANPVACLTSQSRLAVAAAANRAAAASRAAAAAAFI